VWGREALVDVVEQGEHLRQAGWAVRVGETQRHGPGGCAQEAKSERKPELFDSREALGPQSISSPPCLARRDALCEPPH
jgi:hypothetical protein